MKKLMAMTKQPLGCVRKIKFVSYLPNLHPDIETACMDWMGRLMPEDVFISDVHYGCIYPDGLIVKDEDGKRWVVCHQKLVEVK